VFGTAGIAQAEMRHPLKIRNAQTEPVQWAQIDGWAEDDHDAAFATFLVSCKAILSGTRGSRAARPMYTALYDVCGKAVVANPHKPGEAREFFENNFHPVRISPLGNPDGFLTGYYEPIAEGVRKPTEGFDYPLYRRPPGLLSGGRMAIGIAGVSRGKKKAKRRRLVPFHDRAAIDDGILAGRNLEICWLKDPIDAFFAHIQGSVRVRLQDGETLRLNYDAANGHPYVAVGKYLIARNIVPKDEMSMDRIREWMERNPEEGKELRRKNKSYVFFRETHLPSDEEPIGAQGISLTPGRSIAVDRHLHVYGTPFFISAMLPIESTLPTTPFRRLMIAQDTGGAIIGPARADIYFGAGDEAGSVSGRLRHPGRFVMLVPNAISAGPAEEVPLPRTRPSGALLADQEKQEPDEPAKVETEAAKPDAVKPDTAKLEAAKPEVQATEHKAPEAKAEPEPKAEPKAETKVEARTETKAEAKAETKSETKSEAKAETHKKHHAKTADAKTADAKTADAKTANAKTANVKTANKKAEKKKKAEVNPYFPDRHSLNAEEVNYPDPPPAKKSATKHKSKSKPKSSSKSASRS
jgi:membrane-bound lytic murein transglycosylase A